MYGDVQPEKIAWFAREFVCKFTDLDVACLVGQKKAPTVNDIMYAAPEVVQSMDSTHVCLEPSSDVWALGILAHELCTGALSVRHARRAKWLCLAGNGFYGCRPTPEYVRDVLCRRRCLPKPCTANRSIRFFLTRMLCPNPAKRVTAAEALTSRIFRFAEAKPHHRSYTHQVLRQGSLRSTLTCICPCRSAADWTRWARSVARR